MKEGGSAHFWRGRRVLITGVGGFVGTHLAHRLCELGAAVVGVLRDSRGEHRLRLFGLLEKVDLVRGSIDDYALMERVFAEYEVEHCFHLAAQTIVGVANGSPVSTFESNIRGTWTVLEAARHSRHVRGLAIASSDKAYGDQDALPYRETSPLLAVYPYDVSKLCAEALARSYCLSFGLPVGIARCANIYGGGDFAWSRIVPAPIRSMLRNEAPVIRRDGTLQPDYLYGSDAVEAYLLLAQHLDRDEVRGQAFNFGWQRPYSVLEIVETVLREGGSPLHPRILGQGQGEISRQWLDSAKARQLLDWRPRVGLEEGIRRSIAWYRAYLLDEDGGTRQVQTAAQQRR